MAVDEDYWTKESFEDEITRATVALYETRIDPKCAKTSRPGGFRLEDMLAMRRHGVFIPAPDRIVLTPESEEQRFRPGAYQFLKLPESGCLSMGASYGDRSDPEFIQSYCRLAFFRRPRHIPRSMKMIMPGTAYETMNVFVQDDGEIMGLRDYLTVSQPKGQIMPFVEHGRGQLATSIQKRLADRSDPSDYLLAFCLQYFEDMDHQWRITAYSAEETKVTVGAYAENVKSLLYARSLPLTPSGRKRPILHLVSAHRRRMQSGTEIDISEFLRGTREIEMDGVKYKVDAPQRKIDEILAAKAA